MPSLDSNPKAVNPRNACPPKHTIPDLQTVESRAAGIKADMKVKALRAQLDERVNLFKARHELGRLLWHGSVIRPTDGRGRVPEGFFEL